MFFEFDKYSYYVAPGGTDMRKGAESLSRMVSDTLMMNELIYMGYELSVFKKGNREIDFIAVKDTKEYLVQVAYSVAEESTYERKMALFNTLDNSRKIILITTDQVNLSTSTVRHITLSEFLRMDNLE